MNDNDFIGPIPDLSVGSQICKVNIAGYSLDNFRTFNPDGYTVLCRLGEPLHGVNFFPNSSKVVISYQEQSHLFNSLENLVPHVANDLGVTPSDALEVIEGFFHDKDIVVQPVGIQGSVYNIMRGVQNYASMTYMTRAVTTAKTLGLTGTQIINSAPLTFVGATYVGSIFFAYMGTIAGNNTVGLVCNSTSYVLSRPMRGVEVVLNGLILRPISNVVGLPLILNGTSEITSGVGIKLTEYSKIAFAFERIINSTVVKKIKKVYKVIRD